ncbi:hypothetical protein [Streptomyces sp. AK02-01A]|uniref:hypothetical protein n=1 Tax=Streptomyces sp. AK02-01A TaxID=3028648 RepID=UPI0029BAF16B|nr:hypothetical protein [Streptomyces sp. AK02-01A]MDX3855666.1 hypothetical protein [Streptomyces sp. AK02-01A]
MKTPAHLAEWFLVREQFERVPGTAGLYRLTDPETDGPRRTRQAVHDLRKIGFHVQADLSLDPARTEGRPLPAARTGLTDHRARIARAAARSPQRDPGPTTTPPGTSLNRPVPAHMHPGRAIQPGGHGHGRRP